MVSILKSKPIKDTLQRLLFALLFFMVAILWTDLFIFLSSQDISISFPFVHKGIQILKKKSGTNPPKTQFHTQQYSDLQQHQSDSLKHLNTKSRAGSKSRHMTVVLLLCVRAASPKPAGLPLRHHFYVRTADVIGDESRRARHQNPLKNSDTNPPKTQFHTLQYPDLQQHQSDSLKHLNTKDRAGSKSRHMTVVLLLCVRAASPKRSGLPRRHHFYVRTADVIGDESRRARLSTACHYCIILRNLLQLYVNYKQQKTEIPFVLTP